MSSTTTIAWTDATWNPLRGCSRVSEGCRNCYAERYAARFAGPGLPYEGLAEQTPAGPRWTGVVKLIDDQLEKPLRWRKPRRVFVNSMSDLFHESVSDADIARVFRVICEAMHRGRHTYQILTKRAERLPEWFQWARDHEPGWFSPHTGALDLGRVWLGVSVEDQATADARIPLLLETPVRTRFVSAEPLLGPVDLSPWLGARGTPWPRGATPATWAECEWPAWVPAKTRAEIESFWDDSYRGPAAYERSTRDPYNTPPPFGHEGDFLLVTSRDERVRGRYVHAWNNIGRVVDAAGTPHCVSGGPREPVQAALDWVIAGGESGPGARSCHVDWIRATIAQCRAAGVACFVKQVGTRPRGMDPECDKCNHGYWDKARLGHGYDCARRQDAKGADPAEWPEDLRVQDWPA